jgi:hypothetical protein
MNKVLTRYCPECEIMLSSEEETCHNCSKPLYKQRQPKWKANLIGYIYGGVFGSIMLGIVKLGEWYFKFHDRTIEMIVFGLFAVIAWKGKKAQLLERIDLALIKETTASLQDSLSSDENEKQNNNTIVNEPEKNKVKHENTENAKPTSSNTAPKDIKKCPNCGAQYSPEDYSLEATKWLCSSCKTVLPR